MPAFRMLKSLQVLVMNSVVRYAVDKTSVRLLQVPSRRLAGVSAAG